MNKKNVIIALLASIGLHSAPAFLDRPSIPKESCTNQTLDCFLEQREAFNKELYEDVEDGSLDDMSLYEMTFRRDVLAHNIDTARNGFDNFLDTQEQTREFEDFGNSIRYKVVYKPSLTEKLDEIQREMFKGQFRAYLGEEARVSTILERGLFNCDSSTEFHVMLSQFFDIKEQQVLIYTDHLATHVKDEESREWKYEHTKSNGFRIDYANSKKGLIAPTSIFAIAYLLDQGYVLYDFPDWVKEIYQTKLGNESSPDISTNTTTNTTKRYPNPGINSGLEMPDPKEMRPVFFEEGENATCKYNTSITETKYDRTKDILDARISFYLGEAKKGLLYPEAANIDWLKAAEEIITPEYGYQLHLWPEALDEKNEPDNFCYALILDSHFQKLSPGRLNERQKEVRQLYQQKIEDNLKIYHTSTDAELRYLARKDLVALGLLCMPKKEEQKEEKGHNKIHECLDCINITVEQKEPPPLAKTSAKYVGNALEKEKEGVVDRQLFLKIFQALEEESKTEAQVDTINFFGMYADARSIEILRRLHDQGFSQATTHLALHGYIEVLPTLIGKIEKDIEDSEQIEKRREGCFGRLRPSSLYPLEKLADQRSYPVLKKIIENPYFQKNDCYSRYVLKAAVSLAKMGHPEGTELIYKYASRDTFTDDFTNYEQLQAAKFLADVGDKRGYQILRKAVKNGESGAAGYLADLNDATGKDHLLYLLKMDRMSNIPALVKLGYYR